MQDKTEDDKVFDDNMASGCEINPSPDGSILSYVKDNNEKSFLELIDLQGKKIKETEIGVQAKEITWSPDGTKLICYGYLPDPNKMQAFIFERQSGKKVQLINPNKSVNITSVSWNQLGNQILISYFVNKKDFTNIIELAN